jgi:hypothetical protein
MTASSTQATTVIHTHPTQASSSASTPLGVQRRSLGGGTPKLRDVDRCDVRHGPVSITTSASAAAGSAARAPRPKVPPTRWVTDPPWRSSTRGLAGIACAEPALLNAGLGPAGYSVGCPAEAGARRPQRPRPRGLAAARRTYSAHRMG